MATDGMLITRTHEAGADLSAKQYYFVKAAVITDKVDVQTVAGILVDGVIQNDPTSGQQGIVARSGRTKIVAGGSLAVGDEVQCSSAGKAVVTTMGYSLGRVIVAASTGNTATIELYPVPKAIPANSVGSYVNTVVTTATTLTVASPTFVALSAAAPQDVVLPAEALSAGRAFLVFSRGASSLVVKTPGAVTIATVTTGTACWVACDGVTWVKASSIV